jgi:hypothetical protein
MINDLPYLYYVDPVSKHKEKRDNNTDDKNG